VEYDVMFDREQGKAVDARPVQEFDDVDDDDHYHLNAVRLRTI
jgi:hypothetical protein